MAVLRATGPVPIILARALPGQHPMRSTLPCLLVSLVLGAGSLIIHDPAPQERLAAAALQLEQTTGRAYASLLSQANAVLEADSLTMADGHAIGEGGMRLYKDGAVTAWTDHAPISDAALDSMRAAHLVLPDGIYLHAWASGGKTRVHAIRRIWFKPPFENPYLHDQFEQGFKEPRGIVAEPGPGPGALVRDAKGQVMLRLQWADDEALPGTRSLVSLLLALAAIISALAAAWQWGLSQPGLWQRALIFPGLLFGLRLASLLHGAFPVLASYPLFDPTLFASSFFMPSLGDLLINVAILLCAVLFIHRVFRSAGSAQGRWPMALVTAAILFAAAGGIGSVMISLVHDSSVSLDLFRVQDFNGYGFAALLAIGALFCAWCILADALLAALTPALPARAKLLLGLVAACLLAGVNHLSGTYDLMLAAWPLPALVLLEHLRRRPGILPYLALIAILALFTAHVLNRQTLKRIELDRAAVAETVTTREDPVVELLFTEAAQEMRRDPGLAGWLRSGAPCSAADLDHRIRQPFFTGYWDRYDLRMHLVSQEGHDYCSTSPDASAFAQMIQDRFEQGVPMTDHANLRITERPGEEALYIGRVALGNGDLYVELRPRLVADGLGFPELLLAGDRPSSLKPGRFVRARYERGILTASGGTLIFPINWHRALPAEGLRWSADGYDLLAKGDAHGTVLVLGFRVPDGLDHVTTFSYLFLFYCLLAMAIALVARLFGRWRGSTLDVRGKVRLGLAGFAMASLLLFTFGMQRMLNNRRAEQNARTMEERSRGVLAELRQALRGESALTPGSAPYLDHLLGNLSNIFFTDLSLYAPDGVLLATSREQVFNTGLLGRRMDPVAYRKVALEGAASFINYEHIGSAAFSTAYMPFRNDEGKVLAYLALPYFAKQAEVEQERASGYVALVNLFTLLFLLSVVAAALITHWTTRPLELLRRGLERIGLGTRNEPIAYRGNDELGQLVKVYNRKVEELRESAMKLARSERESAWREMAKQVAHEIKNPLTPMKLNIQQFQRTWIPGMPDAKERLDRFSSGLVEQIDVLGRIADEFSHFAQVPAARPEQVDLAEVVRSAVQLFAGTPGCTVLLRSEGPLPVVADREHLLRVFNNLIKNALQAIPDHRPGSVEVDLRREGHEAVAQVRDNGSGIAPQDRDRLFQPSFTTKTSGMGLGLAMVKRMVENAGGRVWFETEAGVGTSFFVTLPLGKS